MTVRELIPTELRAAPAGASNVGRNIDTSDWSGAIVDWSTLDAGGQLTLTWHDTKQTLAQRLYQSSAVQASGLPLRVPVMGPLLDIDIITTGTGGYVLGVAVLDHTPADDQVLLFQGDLNTFAGVGLTFDVSKWTGVTIDYDANPVLNHGFILQAAWDNMLSGARGIVMENDGPGAFTAQVLARPRQYLECVGNSLQLRLVGFGGFGAGEVNVTIMAVTKRGQRVLYHPSIEGTVIVNFSQVLNAGTLVTSRFIHGGMRASLDLAVSDPAAVSGDFAVAIDHVNAIGGTYRIYTGLVTKTGTLFGPILHQTGIEVPPGNTILTVNNASAANRTFVATLVAE